MIFLDNAFYPKSLVVCPKMVLSLEYMVLVAINIIIPGYYCIYCNKWPFIL